MFLLKNPKPHSRQSIYIQINPNIHTKNINALNARPDKFGMRNICVAHEVMAAISPT
eukprot:COSAG01_NODE_61965_length_287_cov_0.436170_2_plen_56_part_01